MLSFVRSPQQASVTKNPATKASLVLPPTKRLALGMCLGLPEDSVVRLT